MARDELSVLSAFLAVAEERSFTRAARRVGVSPSALSHAIRGLEEQVGVRLLARTTRSVAPTDAGELLLSHLRPSLGDIREALEQVSGLRDRPAGRIRVLAPRIAARTVLAPKLALFARRCPDVVLDITTTDDRRMDLVAAGFDAGIQLGEYIQRDMVAVRVSRDRRPAIVGSPGYFEAYPKPRTPRDLTRHRCLNFRQGSDVYRWEFDKANQSLVVAVNGPLIADDVEVLIRAALDGVGLAFMSDEQAAPHLASGALVRVLEDWCPPYPGFFLYYPSRRQQPAALAALIETLRLS